MSDIHPFEGERMERDATLRFWDDYADVYSSMQQGDIPERVVDILRREGYLGRDSDVLELGSGPGTYSLLVAPCVRSLTCMDTSPRMLDRLMASAGSKGLGNITPLLQDWGTYPSDPGCTTVMASLCPGTGSPDSIRRMESLSSYGCVVVSWLENHGDDLTAQVWQELGKDYGFGFRSSNPTLDWLTENGREPDYDVLETRIVADLSVDDLVEKERSAFRAYGVREDVGPIVRRLLEPEDDGGVIHYDRVNRMKLIRWRSGRDHRGR